MKVLVIGGGAREHALVWKISQSKKVTEIFCAPGNGGIEALAECVNIQPDDVDTLLRFALKEKIDLTVVGPEVPLTLGIVDQFKGKGLSIFGPTANAALLEGSKAYAKAFMSTYAIPTADYRICDRAEEALKYLEKTKYPIVIKADGLAAGKGVIICNNFTEAQATVLEMMVEKRFDTAGERVVIESFLEGTETSLLCLLDGNRMIPLASAKDYKKAYDYDKGPNTGGMGCISPSPSLNEGILEKIKDEILDRLKEGFKKASIDYKGVLFIGLIMTKEGPKVLEFNVRLGDPETEVILPRLKGDIIEIIEKVLAGNLHPEDLKWQHQSCVTVVASSKGYPFHYEKHKVIDGLDQVDKDVLVFHAGTRKTKGDMLTNGGRVLAVTAMGDTIAEARERVYRNMGKIDFDGMTYREDIGTL